MFSEELPRAYRVTDVIVENDATRTYLLDGELDATPGQFVMVWLPGVDEKPFSLADTRPVALTVTNVGRFTAAVHSLEEGERLWVRGPFGDGFSPGDGPALLAGGGYGSAPLSFLARELRSTGQDVHVALGAKTADELVLSHRFRNLGCRVHHATEDGTEGQVGLVTDLATLLLERIEFGAIYACGPNPMLDAVAVLAAEWKVPYQLSYEAHMRCGIGVCGSCTRDDQLVCRDGPVLKTSTF